MKCKLIITSLFFTISSYSFAQKVTESNDTFVTSYRQAFIPKTQFRLNISPTFYNQLKIENSGANWLKSNPAFGGTIGIGLYQKVYNDFGVTANVNLGIFTYNMNYYFQSKVDHPDVTFDDQDLKNTDYIPFVNYNFGVSYKLNYTFFKQILSPTIGIGIMRNTLPTFDISVGSSIYIDEQEPNLRIFDSNVTDYTNSNESSFSFNSYYLTLGVVKQNKKHNTLHLNLIVNYTHRKIGKGQYQFSNLEKESNGTTKLGFNYIGLEFVYGLTFNKPK